MMHPVIAASKSYAAWEKEQHALDERLGSLRSQIANAELHQRKADAEHAQKVESATRKGKPIPAKPQRMDFTHLDAAMAIQRRDEADHRTTRQAALAEAATSGALDALEERDTARRDRLTALLPELEALLAEARADAGAYQLLVRAVDQQEGIAVRPSRGDRIPTALDLPTILYAARSGKSLLEPSPLPPLRPSQVTTDLDWDDSNEAGLRRALASDEPLSFGNSDSRPRVPILPSRGVEI